MMPTDFDAALEQYLGRRVTPQEHDGTAGFDGLDRVRSPQHVAIALPFLAMSLDQFAARGALLEVRVPWLNVTLWLVPADRDVAALLRNGVGRGRIWTAAELIDLMAIQDRTAGQVRTLAYAKLALDGDVIGVRVREARP